MLVWNKLPFTLSIRESGVGGALVVWVPSQGAVGLVNVIIEVRDGFTFNYRLEPSSLLEALFIYHVMYLRLVGDSRYVLVSVVISARLFDVWQQTLSDLLDVLVHSLLVNHDFHLGTVDVLGKELTW